MSLESAKYIAERCTHYGMCKIDFLGTDVCPSGLKSKYVSYYPQGRMEIFNTLLEGVIPVTEGLIDVVNSCTLCGICDKQCYFITELRPMIVMKALKEYIKSHMEKNKPIEKVEEDEVLKKLIAVVGPGWASNDPAILAAYSRDTSPVLSRCMPRYVVMPESTPEVAEIIRTANKYKIPFVPRGTGANTFGIALGKGIIIDLSRLKTLKIEPENWSATVGAGVTAFDLQKEVNKQGMRVNVAEPAACVCSNIVCTGIYSPFSHAYGIMADNYIDAEIVTRTGSVFQLKDRKAPNLFGFRDPIPGVFSPSPGICTQATVKLYPIPADEESVFIPFSDFHEALKMTGELGRRRIGTAAALLGTEYLSTFVSPTLTVAGQLEYTLKEKLGLDYLLMVLVDKYEKKIIKEMVDIFIDEDMMKMVILSIPRLYSDEGIELLSKLSQNEKPYKLLFQEDMKIILKMELSPSPDNIAEVVDEDLKDFFRKVYLKPEMTDFIWLNMFRILSSRMGRSHAFAARIYWCPLDPPQIIEICDILKAIGDQYKLRNKFGFLTPIDFGKRAVLEYDYYFHQTNEEEKKKVTKAMIQSIKKIGALKKRIKWLKTIEIAAFQGLSRKENFLYR